MQMSIGLDRLKRFVCLLLIFVLLFCFFMCPRASAVALEATTIAYGGLLVGTILVGAGVVFSSHGDMVKVGNAMYKTLVNGSSAIGKTISSISAWAVEHGKQIGSAALRIGKDLYQGIVDAFNASYSNGNVSLGSDVVTLPVNATEDEIQSFMDLFAACNVTSFYWRQNTGRDFEAVHHIYYTVSGSVYTMVVDNFGSDHGLYTQSKDIENDTFVKAFFILSHRGDRLAPTLRIVCKNYTYSVDYFSYISEHLSVSLDPISVSVPKPDLKYPSDDYLVKMPDIPSVDTASGDVTYPNDTAYTKDAVAAPYPIGDDGVKVPDIPYDIPVDQTSGKPMDDTGTDTDNPSKPGEGTDTDKPSDSVNWPSAGDISLPKLIISKFPFCIPFDVARLIGLLEADPKTPIFHVPLKVGTILNEEIVLDLSQWDNAVRIIRWGELIVFVAGLVLVTRNYIKW